MADSNEKPGKGNKDLRGCNKGIIRIFNKDVIRMYNKDIKAGGRVIRI